MTFQELFSYENLYKSAKLCFKGKRDKLSILFIEANLPLYIKQLQNELFNNQYLCDKFIHFRKFNGNKYRNIDALYIKDAIVYKCLCQFFIIPNLMNTLIYDNCASQKYKGLHFTFNRLKKFLHDHYCKYKTQGGYLLFDIKYFFETIDHFKLKEFLMSKIKDKQIYNLLCHCIDANQQIYKRNAVGNNKYQGLGLGTELSQLLALIYTSPLDHYIKEKLKIKYYLRYVDDCIIIHHNIDYLYKIKEKINMYLQMQLNLNLNQYKTKIIKFVDNNTIVFLKTKFVLNNQQIHFNFKNIKKKIKLWQKLYESGKMSIKDILILYQSWRSYVIHGNDDKKIQYIDNLFNSIFIK